MIWHGLATYDLNGVERPGLVVDNKLYDLAQLALAGQPEQTIGMPDVDGLLDAWDAWVPVCPPWPSRRRAWPRKAA